MDKILRFLGSVFATVMIILCGVLIQIGFEFHPFISWYFTGTVALFFNYQFIKNNE